MDTPRAVTIIYRGSQAKPMGFVQIDATDTTAPAPDEMSLLLKRPDGSFVTFTTGSTEIFYSSGSGASRLAAQFDATTLATGAYNYTVVARSWRSGAYQEATYPTRVLIENEIGSLVGAGWSIGGFQRIFVQSDASVVITEGDGSIAFFKADLCPVNCNFAPAAGDFTTLTTVGTYPPISGYTRQYPDGTIVTFSTSGLMMSVRDRFGNQTNYGYDASNRLTSITDPAGKAISFGYTGANKLDWIKDPGTPVRTTDITVNAATDYTITSTNGSGITGPSGPSASDGRCAFRQRARR
jgi:YD repeat-containing protein